jgi:hypothetical protein
MNWIDLKCIRAGIRSPEKTISENVESGEAVFQYECKKLFPERLGIENTVPLF